MQTVAQRQNEVTRKELQILFGRENTSATSRLTARDVSLVHTATACLLTELGGPPAYRMICGVIGLALGSAQKFECVDLQLAKRIWSDSDATDASLQKRLARDRDKLIEWQQQQKIVILRYTQGDQTRDSTGKLTNHPTEWECPILPLITQILEDAPMEADYDSHPGRAIHRVAASVAKVERMKMPTAAKRTRRSHGRVGFDWFMKTAVGLLRKACAESGQTWEQVIDQLRTLENGQVIDSKGGSPADILSTPPPENGYSSPQTVADSVPHEDLKKGYNLGEEEGPQRRATQETVPPPSVALSSDTYLPEVEADLPYGLPDPDPDHVPDYPLDLPAPEKQASESLCTFISRGYRHFFFRLENDSRDTVRHQTLTAATALGVLADWLSDADKRHASFMVRPMWAGKPQADLTPAEQQADEAEVRPRALHLDDIDHMRFAMVQPYAALGFTSSPDRYQAFIFVTADKHLADAIRKRLVRSLHSDVGANGAFRLPGSKNWKRTRGGCPVTLHVATFGSVWTPAQLEQSGLLAPPEPPRLSSLSSHSSHSSNGSNGAKFPDYPRCIDSAPLKSDGITPDYSAADLAWANICRDRGIAKNACHSELERLRCALDGKPDKHPGYITLTVNKAYD